MREFLGFLILVCALASATVHKIPLSWRKRFEIRALELWIWLEDASIDSAIRRGYSAALAALEKIKGTRRSVFFARTTAVIGICILMPILTTFVVAFTSRWYGLILHRDFWDYTLRTSALVFFTGTIAFAGSVTVTAFLIRIARDRLATWLYPALLCIDVAIAIALPVLMATTLLIGRDALGARDYDVVEIGREDATLIVFNDESVTPLEVSEVLLDTANYRYAIKTDPWLVSLKEGIGGVAGAGVGLQRWEQPYLTDKQVDAVWRDLVRPLLQGDLRLEPDTLARVRVEGKDNFVAFLLHLVKPFPVVGIYAGEFDSIGLRLRLYRYLGSELVLSVASLRAAFGAGSLQIGLHRSMANWLFLVCLIPTAVHALVVLTTLMLKIAGEVARRPTEAVLRYVLEHPAGSLVAIALLLGVVASIVDIVANWA